MFIVSGGRFEETTSEILDLNTLNWREGPSLPTEVQESYGAQFGETFVVVDESGIYEFDPENEAWIIWPETLDPPRSGMSATFVKDDIVTCSL